MDQYDSREELKLEDVIDSSFVSLSWHARGEAEA